MKSGVKKIDQLIKEHNPYTTQKKTIIKTLGTFLLAY
jgi:hypothetical protein